MVLFRRLAVLTAAFAYLQIALGGLVRVSGSGLGCPDWPLCHGKPYPPADAHSIIEYSHRAVGSVTGVLLIATVVLAWVIFRQRRPLVAWLATASLVAITGEGLLGALVVFKELQAWLVVIHLGLAMIILGLLIATAVMAMKPQQVVIGGRPRLRWATVGGTYLLLLTGSSVVASGADERCHSWPLCGNGLVPSFAGVDALTMLHRGSALVVGLLILHTCATLLRRSEGPIRIAAWLTIAALVAQILVGALSAVTAAALFDGMHVALASAVFAGILTTALLTLPRADPQTAPRLVAGATA